MDPSWVSHFFSDQFHRSTNETRNFGAAELLPVAGPDSGIASQAGPSGEGGDECQNNTSCYGIGGAIGGARDDVFSY